MAEKQDQEQLEKLVKSIETKKSRSRIAPSQRILPGGDITRTQKT